MSLSYGLKNWRLRTACRRPRPYRPQCELLEDRTVPSTFFVDDSLKAGAGLATLGGRVTLDRDGSGTLTDGDQVTFALGEPNQAVALTFRAAPTALAPAAGDAGTAFQTIADALGSGSVAAGDTVQVAAGTYSEAVALSKAVTLQGSGSAVTFLAGTGSGTGLNVTAANATVSGFTVQHFALGVSATTATTRLSLADLHLSGNTAGGLLTGVAAVTVSGDDMAATWVVDAAAFGRAGEDSVGFSGVAHLTVDGGAGADTFIVHGTAAGTAVQVNGGAGDDTFVVTSAADRLDTFAGPLAVDGGAGSNELFVTEIGSSIADTVTVTATALSGTAVPWHIDYTATGGTFGRGVFFTAGSGDDTLNVQGTAADSPTFLYGWGGNDVFNVVVQYSPVGPLYVDGNAGTNKLSVFMPDSPYYPTAEGSVTLSANAITGSLGSSLSLAYTATGGTFGQGITLNAPYLGTLNVQGLAAEAPTTVNGFHYSFNSTLGPGGVLAGPVSITGATFDFRGHYPTVSVSEEDPVGDVLILYPREIQSLARPFVITFDTGLTSLQTGSGDDYVRVLGMGYYYDGVRYLPSTINTGAGNNTIVVGSAAGQLSGLGGFFLNAGGGTGNTLYVTAAGETGNVVYDINAAWVLGSGGFIMQYGPAGAFGGGIYFVGAAGHTNSVQVNGTAADVRTVVFGGDAANVISVHGGITNVLHDDLGLPSFYYDYRDWIGAANVFQGDLVLVTGAGDDTVLVQGPLSGIHLRIDTGAGNDGVRVELTPTSGLNLWLDGGTSNPATGQDALLVVDTAGGAAIYQLLTGANTGLINVLYSDGLTSYLGYANLEAVTTIPAAL
jgi:hypothetical protein